ncbi:chaperonin 10-like protein [Lipomyces tetrasporus]|uniref:Chaperonin 10-like protein n=1 Tax=Lipomyces tetrasporus TaxID=54092 RepID=A0AAD7QT34_9ASCO|nr:chaperonin 10-like protein [Lipomyces tetrasporus]KAJ8100846.1 chaperonin 10-like protein [Lipomyces tetrasporus]
MACSYPPAHAAVVVPTEAPQPGEVVVKVQWTASSPADLHQADGNLVTDYPFILGCSFAGTIVAVGPEDPSAVAPDSKSLEVGDRVCGYAMWQQKQSGFQTYVTVPRHMTGRIPENLSMEAAVTLPVNLPWPVPPNYTSQEADKPILVWGAAGSVGNYIVQVLRHWGYRNLLAVASKKHHNELKRFGATEVFDYSESNVVEQILAVAGHIPYDAPSSQQDCRPGTRVAVVVPIVIHHAMTKVEPQLTRDPSTVLVGEWKDGVEVIPIMTFFYQDNEYFKWHLQPDVIPALLRAGAIKPNKQRIIEAETLLERAQQALNLLRERVPSGERLVWRISDS